MGMCGFIGDVAGGISALVATCDQAQAHPWEELAKEQTPV